MTSLRQTCRILESASRALADWATRVRAEADSSFEAARQIATRLGAHYRNGVAEIGFWAPETLEGDVSSEAVYLEVFNPVEAIDFRAKQQEIRFHRQRLKLVQDGEFCWGVVAGMQPGSRSQAGSFYWLIYRTTQGEWRTVPDPLANSIPFGSFAPAEFYDMGGLQQSRSDQGHFREHLDTEPGPDGVPRIRPPANILQIHVGTASPEGTIEGLTRLYVEITEKIERGVPLSPRERNYIGYDAVQLMPIEPTIEHEVGPRFWRILESADQKGEVKVELLTPDMTNWGYDVLICGSPATNPALLGSKRPEELVDFIVALHHFPEKPIKVIFDIVYGHLDNQSLPLLNRHFFAGANMYGQNVNFLNPNVRAILLEMQRRKHDYGVDGVRVDGAQDFKNWDPETDTLWHDDDYLRLMNEVVQEVAGVRYRPWMIFEDGRPWPRDDWELASTYREVTKQMPNVWQWGPLTFAHNTPFLFTFWISKWWRIREITQVGKHWITGCANHDTLRRGTQVDPKARINTYLGDSLPEIFKNAYDNPAAKLFDYACMPGIPMDFINATMRAPWSFVRNTDERYGVKVMSEEARFLHWAVDDARFGEAWTFPRLKALGFTGLGGLRRFVSTLDYFVKATGYKLDVIATLMQSLVPPLPGPPLTAAALKGVAKAWMDDMNSLCNVSHYGRELDPEQVDFNLAVREFRRERPWLMENFEAEDTFDYLHPPDSTVLFFGVRNSPDKEESVLFLGNMEGAARTFVPLELPIPNLPRDGWERTLVSPGLEAGQIDESVTLRDSQGVVYTREKEA